MIPVCIINLFFFFIYGIPGVPAPWFYVRTWYLWE